MSEWVDGLASDDNWFHVTIGSQSVIKEGFTTVIRHSTVNFLLSLDGHVKLLFLTYFVEVLAREKSQEAAHEVTAGHDLLAFELLQRIFVENFAELLGRCPFEIRWSLKKKFGN